MWLPESQAPRFNYGCLPLGSLLPASGCASGNLLTPIPAVINPTVAGRSLTVNVFPNVWRTWKPEKTPTRMCHSCWPPWQRVSPASADSLM